MALTFNILDWKAWTPAHDAQPDVSAIPAMLRRRLSPIARAAMSVIMPLAQAYGAMPLVYVSRHGDLNRTLGLLEELARGEPVSPAAFSLSVHNATAGLFSIQQGLTQNIVALSAGAEDLVPALLESVGLCNPHSPRVLCVFSDEPPPPVYAHQIDQPAQPYALALVIESGHGWQLAHSPAASANTETNTEINSNQDQPQALQLLDLLQQQATELWLSSNTSQWQLRRYPA